jgi:hypothetical protein
LSRRKVDSATNTIFQINAVAFSTFLKRLAAVVRKRTVAKGDSSTFVIRKCGQFLQTFKEFPPSQQSGSFSVDHVLDQLQAPGGK